MQHIEDPRVFKVNAHSCAWVRRELFAVYLRAEVQPEPLYELIRGDLASPDSLLVWGVSNINRAEVIEVFRSDALRRIYLNVSLRPTPSIPIRAQLIGKRLEPAGIALAHRPD